jgi:uncharacterized protein (TIGR03067 family)
MQTTLLIIVLALGAPAPKDKPANDKSVIGDWVAEEVIVNGKPLVSLETTRWRFAADGTRGLYRDGAWEQAGSYIIGQDSSMDLNSLNADELCPCLYKVSGDTLILCVTSSMTGRPKDFDSVDCTKYVFRRVTKKN